MFKNSLLPLLVAALVMMAIPTKAQGGGSGGGSGSKEKDGDKCDTHEPKFSPRMFFHNLLRYDAEMKGQAQSFDHYVQFPPQTEKEWEGVGLLFEDAAKTYLYEAYSLSWIIETILTDGNEGFAEVDFGQHDCKNVFDVSLNLDSYTDLQTLDYDIGQAVIADFPCFAALFKQAEGSIDPQQFDKDAKVTIVDVLDKINVMFKDMYMIMHSGHRLYEAHKKIEKKYIELHGGNGSQSTKRNLGRILELLEQLKGSNKLGKLLRRRRR